MFIKKEDVNVTMEKFNCNWTGIFLAFMTVYPNLLNFWEHLLIKLRSGYFEVKTLLLPQFLAK